MSALLQLPLVMASRRLGKRGLPRMLTYTVTFACNARCSMCDSWKKLPEEELSLPELEKIFGQLPPMDAVRLTGGEPFVRKDFGQIVDLVEKHLDPRIIHITTNGFLTEAIRTFCVRRNTRKPLHILLSLDGTEQLHNQVRGRKFAWELASATLRLLVANREEWNLRLAVNQTIVDGRGLAEYESLHNYLRPLEVDHHVVVAYRESATYSTEKHVDLSPRAGGYKPWGDLPRPALEKFLQIARHNLSELSFANRLAKGYYLRGIANRLLEGKASPNPPCAALHQHLRIFPNGDVPTCQFNTKVVGNLRRQSFTELWQSKEAREGAAWVRACSGCWAECEVVPSALYSGDF